MDSIYLPYGLNVLLIVAFIFDRVFRLWSIKEYKEAKDAQITTLHQQLDFERKNNDIEITQMHKERYESLKIILEEKEIKFNEKEAELKRTTDALLDLKSELESANKEVDLKATLSNKLLVELNRVEKNKHDLEVEKKTLLAQIENVRKLNTIKFAQSRSGYSNIDAMINNILVNIKSSKNEVKPEDPKE